MQKYFKKPILVATVSGVLAALLALAFLKIQERKITGQGEKLAVLVAVEAIEARSIIKSSEVTTKLIPKLYIQPGALSDIGDLAGKISIADIQAGEQLTKTKLLPAGVKSGLSYKVPKGKRGVSISVSPSDAAGGLIKPDDRVDIVATFKERGREFTLSLLQDLSVLAVDSEMYLFNDSDHKPSENETKMPWLSSRLPSGGNIILTMAVSPIDTERLILAKRTAKLSVALRGPADRATQKVRRPMSSEMLMEQGGILKGRYREYKGR